MTTFLSYQQNCYSCYYPTTLKQSVKKIPGSECDGDKVKKFLDDHQHVIACC